MPRLTTKRQRDYEKLVLPREMREKDQRRRRWMHANIRLKLRYDIELTWDEYEAANNKFRTRTGVEGLKVNYRGDLEGWIQIKDEWIPCIYSVKDCVIATFFAKPPPRISSEEMKSARKAAKAELKSEYAKLQKEAMEQARQHYQYMIKQWVQSKAARNQPVPMEAYKEAGFSADTVEKAEQESLLSQAKALQDKVWDLKRRCSEQEEQLRKKEAQLHKTSCELGNIYNLDPESHIRAADVRWFKGKMTEAVNLLKEGKVEEAIDFLHSIGGLPKSFRPTLDLDLTNKIIQERIESEHRRRAEEST